MHNPMKHAFLVFAAAVLCSGARAGSAALPAGAVDGQVAVVNGRAISYSEVLREVPLWAAAARAAAPGEQDPEALFRAAFRLALDDAENRALVLAKYEEGEMKLPERAIDRYTAEILQSRYNGNLQELQKDLSAQNLTYAEWRARKEEGMIVAAMRHSFVDGNASVSPNEVAAAWESRKAEFSRPARMHLRVASVPAADTNAVAAFSARLASGEPFGSVAADLAPDRDRDYGFVGADNALAPMFMEAAAGLADGASAGPLELADHAYFLHRIESEAARTVPLSEAWDTLRGELLAERREALYKAWTARLRAAASIRETLPWRE